MNVLRIYILLGIAAILFSYQLSANNPKADSLNELIIKENDQTKKVDYLIQLCKLYQYSNISRAITTGKQAKFLAEKINRQDLLTDARLELSRSYSLNGNMDIALEILDSTLLINREVVDHHKDADIHGLAGYIQWRRGKNDQARERYESCLQLSIKYKYLKGEAIANKGFGDLEERDGNYFSALDFYETALNITKSIKDIELEINITNAIGIVYDYQGNLQRAQELYIEALTKAEKIKNYVRAEGICSNVASILYYLDNDEKAIEYYLKSLSYATETNNTSGKATSYQGLSTTYKRLGDLNKAKLYANNDLEIRLLLNDKRGLSYAHKNLGAIYHTEKKYALAEKEYILGLRYAEETGQKIKIIVMHKQLGRLYNDTGDYNSAIKVLNKAKELCTEINAPRELCLIYEDLADSYANSGNLKKAFEYQKLFSDLIQTLTNQDIQEQSARMQTIYETKNRDEKIATLEQQKLLNEKIINQSKLVKNLLLVGLLLLFVLVALFYNLSRIKQKNNNILKAKNNEIDNQRQEIQQSLEIKETLLKEIHHRVKNNLQIISSLLNLQSKNIKDKNVLSSLNEGKNRVEAMSLIHQNLYQSDNLTSISMHNYLEQLMHHLSSSFHSNDKIVKYQIETNNVEFDIDTAIPIGLIVNELVSNAYKHAFPRQQKGNIYINLSKKDNKEFVLEVKDDGIGIPMNLDIKKTNSLGLKLVKSLSTKQLKGSLEISNSKGTVFEIKFKDESLVSIL